MVRVFSGVTRSQILKSEWCPATGGTQAVIHNTVPGYRVDHAGDVAIISWLVAPVFTAVGTCDVVFIGNANLVNMNATLTINMGNAAGIYNLVSNTAVRQQNTTTDNYGTLWMAATGIVGLLVGINVNLRVSVEVSYSAVVPATNIDVVGAYFSWL